MFSLSAAIIDQILNETLPSFQLSETRSLNLGLGFLYYGFARAMRPGRVAVIGSKKGFSVVCIALGMRDNEGFGFAQISCYETRTESADRPQLFFVDPSYSVHRGDPNHMWGVGFWDDAKAVESWWQNLGVSGIVTHYKLTSEEFASSCACPPSLDMVLLDGDHTPEGISRDVHLYGPRLSSCGIMLIHDVHPECRLGGAQAYEDLDCEMFEAVRLPLFPGLAIVRRRDVPLPEILVDPR